jgi:hypothetical protein
MNTFDNTDDELHMCQACFGTGEEYDGEEDIFIGCTNCNATGLTTEAQNECYLDSILNYN